MSGDSILERPFVRFGREMTGSLEAASRREWLVTNGLGGYASGTASNLATRRYHGLLVAALAPPVDRTVLVAGSLEWLVVGDRRVSLSSAAASEPAVEHADEPDGLRLAESFALDGMLPVWRFAIGDALVERRVWMSHGRNVSCLGFRLVRGSLPVVLEVAPLLTDRDHHVLAVPSVGPDLRASGDAFTAVFPEDHAAARVRAFGGRFRQGPGAWHDVFLAEERARGLDETTRVFEPGSFRFELAPGRLVGLAFAAIPHDATAGASAEAPPDLQTSFAEEPPDLQASLAEERARQRGLLERAAPAVRGAQAAPLDRFAQQLVLAADQFLVARAPGPSAESGPPGAAAAGGRTVIAGYHWFNDWGRDTMIALPGLTLATGRPEEGAAILRSFAPYVRDGLLPNNFPDRSGVEPAYNTVDASLWYVVAIDRHVRATGDRALLDELLPVVRDIVDRHRAGTRFGIGMADDGLLRAGEPGLQLTWMDVRIANWVVTPRIGKPVEINALWYNALRALAAWLQDRDSPAAAGYAALAERVQTAFRNRFVRPESPHLADVVDGPDGDDWSVRPNQLLALSLPYPLLEGPAARRPLDACAQTLVTSLGVRSLDPADPDYHGTYGGDLVARDSAYHQGTAWTWLIGPFVEAYLRLTGDTAAARSFLAPFVGHLRDAGLGSVSELVEGDAPHRPRGCIAQAWGVAEVLRTWRLVCEREGLGGGELEDAEATER